MMNTFVLLTIIAGTSLQSVIEQDISALGAKGYTTSPVEGKGKSGVRNDIWSGENVKIETIVSKIVLPLILETLRLKYFDRYPVIAYYHSVAVMRTDHFS